MPSDASSDLVSEQGAGGVVLGRWILGIAMLCNAAAIAIVNFWIYRALAVYARNFPERMAVHPITVSRAITDPEVSDPFAAWITFSALILPIGVAVVALLQARVSQTAIGRGLAWSMVVFQLGSSVGMVLLSHYRFPDHDEIHMAGSFLFFISQTAMILACGLSARHVLRHGAGLSESLLRGNRLRVLGAIWVACLAAAYLCLFVGKGYVSGKVYTVVYKVYTLTEPALISSFLAVFAFYFFDLIYYFRRVNSNV
ncbi:hypothetical protein [Shimia sp. FJ5]|uniref:hypothetical protein n=1 Tax=Shimia sp. FJ5 TaxID=3079054 RepID=UPI0026096D3F|nr:hypothetical protein [Shimia sp. FJ5]MDV4144705.1 hypothetical protein [Shimia sp. FJ5]